MAKEDLKYGIFVPEPLQYQVVRLKNPTAKEFTFSWDGVGYEVGAGEVKEFPRFLAMHGAKKLAQHIIINDMKKPLELAERQEELMRSLISDPILGRDTKVPEDVTKPVAKEVEEETEVAEESVEDSLDTLNEGSEDLSKKTIHELRRMYKEATGEAGNSLKKTELIKGIVNA